MKVESTNETEYGITVRIARPSTRYLDEFIRLRCAPDLLAHRLFPNAKEITESMAAWNAIRKCMRGQLDNPSVVVFDVASGVMPRTSGVIAHLTPWTVHAIDPELRADTESLQRINRLFLHAVKVQDFELMDPPEYEYAIIVAVHPHVRVEHLVPLARYAKQAFIISIECCVPQVMPDTLSWVQRSEHSDFGILSPKRTVRVWSLP